MPSLLPTVPDGPDQPPRSVYLGQTCRANRQPPETLEKRPPKPGNTRRTVELGEVPAQEILAKPRHLRVVPERVAALIAQQQLDRQHRQPVFNTRPLEL